MWSADLICTWPGSSACYLWLRRSHVRWPERTYVSVLDYVVLRSNPTRSHLSSVSSFKSLLSSIILFFLYQLMLLFNAIYNSNWNSVAIVIYLVVLFVNRNIQKLFFRCKKCSCSLPFYSFTGLYLFVKLHIYVCLIQSICNRLSLF